MKETETRLEMREIKYEILRLKRLEKAEKEKHKFRTPDIPVQTLEDMEVSNSENEIITEKIYNMRKGRVKDTEMIRQEIKEIEENKVRKERKEKVKEIDSEKWENGRYQIEGEMGVVRLRKRERSGGGPKYKKHITEKVSENVTREPNRKRK